MILRRVLSALAFLLVLIGISFVEAKIESLLDVTTSAEMQRLLSHKSSYSGGATRGTLAATAATAEQYRSRRMQNVTLTEQPAAGNASAAFLKCYSLLSEVAAAASTLGQDDYVQYLKMLTNGDVSVDRFPDLPVVFVMIFYTAACPFGTDCMPGNTPAIAIGDTSNPSDDLQLFCKQTLRSTFNTADASFEYSVRYNPDNVDEGALAVCLSTATVNVLLEQLASCPMIVGARRQLSHAVSHAVQNSPSWATYNAERRERWLQSLGSATTANSNSTCAYAIESTVQRITELRKFFVRCRSRCSTSWP